MDMSQEKRYQGEVRKDLEYNKVNQDKVILSVEDNLINQEVMESMIRKKGYQFLAAYDGYEALDILRNNKVDLINGHSDAWVEWI